MARTARDAAGGQMVGIAKARNRIAKTSSAESADASNYA
jgi:hypothetical protein